MLKRELEFSASAAETQPSPAKRHKDDSSQEPDVSMSDPPVAGAEANASEGVSVTEQGLQLWNAVKNAVSKEGRVYSVNFMRKPPKRLYPDYYQIIEMPIALEDIKKRLDTGLYQSLEGVKHDLDLCFTNAKKYNMKDSEIWKDAKHLHKLVNREYNKVTGDDEQIDIMADGREKNAGDEEGDEEGKKKNKNKAPNMNRLLKSRLQKLVNKTDETGRVLSTEFMELPSKKDWPMYYKQIKRPQCLENIFKHIKRREYLACAEFASDVELVFSNAMTFNVEHTAIWEDALTLRDYFRHLMSDLPEPFTLTEYTKPTHGKIKLKMSSSQNLTTTASSPALQATSSSGSVVLRVPGSNSTQMQNKLSMSLSSSATQTVAQPSTQAPNSKPVPTPLPKTGHTQSANQQTLTQTPTQSVSYPSTTYNQHYPNATYQPTSNPSGASLGPITQTSTGLLVQTTNYFARHTSHSNSPAPPQPNYMLKSVSLRVEPTGRPFNLDHREGVKLWVMRVSKEERRLRISDIKFLRDDGEDSGVEDVQEEHEDKDEDEEEPEMEGIIKNGKKKSKGKNKGKARGKTGSKTKGTRSVKKTKPKMDEIQVKVNGVITKESEDHPGEWQLELLVGWNSIEIGEKGGLVWKVQAERSFERTHVQ